MILTKVTVGQHYFERSVRTRGPRVIVGLNSQEVFALSYVKMHIETCTKGLRSRQTDFIHSFLTTLDMTSVLVAQGAVHTVTPETGSSPIAGTVEMNTTLPNVIVAVVCDGSVTALALKQLCVSVIVAPFYCDASKKGERCLVFRDSINPTSKPGNVCLSAAEAALGNKLALYP